jgi:hypothetical protein
MLKNLSSIIISSDTKSGVANNNQTSLKDFSKNQILENINEN